MNIFIIPGLEYLIIDGRILYSTSMKQVDDDWMHMGIHLT